MSAATADCLLRAHRHPIARGLSTTKAGPLLKQQIPIRTFFQWDEAQPGFLEADLVAHCGGHLDGGCLYTLTLTDVATGWTECLPLLNRGQEAVVAALQGARMLFPFPILGIDTDNGGEFINEEVASYCAHEQITFTRGRPYEKRDQCFVEQKNGVVVRQVVGHGRLTGDHACQQLAELYRALRLYVNCFQPSMKLVAKQVEGRTVRRVYDAARTPLQRLLLSGVLPASKQQELSAAAMALDPIRLLHHVQQLQQAVLRCEVSGSSVNQRTSVTSLQKFEIEDGMTKPPSSEEMGHDEGAVSENGDQGPPETTHLLDWRRTSKDPFADQWEQILSWIQVNPTRSSGDIFRELQSLFPGRYQPLHIRSLQRGMGRIRALVLEMGEGPRQKEVIHGDLVSPVELHQAKSVPEGFMRLSSRFAPTELVDPSAGETSRPFSPHHPTAEDQSMHIPVREREAPTKSESRISSPERGNCLTIEGAIQSYLQIHHKARHSPKTLEWHQMALRHLQHYLLAELHLLLVSQIRETDIRGWVVFLAQTPTVTGKLRSASTIETYARSVRAFCTWLVHRGELLSSPMSEDSFPRTRVPLPQLIPTEIFEQFLQAGSLSEAKASEAKSMAVRDRAILWVLFETGISVCEVCSLRLGDVDRETGTLSVRGKGGNVRQLPLGPACLDHLLSYLKQVHSEKKDHGAERNTGDEPLFLSEKGRSLTSNAVTLLFVRLSKRVGSSGIAISPRLLRHSFALRYLQAGGNPHSLKELLGYEGMPQVKRYLAWYDQLVRDPCNG